MGFQVQFECFGFLLISEANHSFKKPGSISCSMSRLSHVMSFQTFLRINRESGVMSVRFTDATWYIDLIHHHLLAHGIPPIIKLVISPRGARGSAFAKGLWPDNYFENMVVS